WALLCRCSIGTTGRAVFPTNTHRRPTAKDGGCGFNTRDYVAYHLGRIRSLTRVSSRCTGILGTVLNASLSEDFIEGCQSTIHIRHPDVTQVPDAEYRVRQIPETASYKNAPVFHARLNVCGGQPLGREDSGERGRAAGKVVKQEIEAECPHAVRGPPCHAQVPAKNILQALLSDHRHRL